MVLSFFPFIIEISVKQQQEFVRCFFSWKALRSRNSNRILSFPGIYFPNILTNELPNNVTKQRFRIRIDAESQFSCAYHVKSSCFFVVLWAFPEKKRVLLEFAQFMLCFFIRLCCPSSHSYNLLVSDLKIETLRAPCLNNSCKRFCDDSAASKISKDYHGFPPIA